MTQPAAMLLTALCVGCCCSCGTSGGSPDYGAPGQPLREIATAIDINKEIAVVEVNLTAAESQYEFRKGQPTTLWTYNGQFPGPVIEAKVGDEIVVHFTNNLPVETTIHWHGLRLPQPMDGAHASQRPVPPGGSFEYRFTAQDAGLFWYHPHHHSSHQVPMGLYGPLLVRGPGEPPSTRERVLVLSDIELDANGAVVRMHQLTHDPITHALGPEGNTQLVNGQVTPHISMRTGSRERWRVVNAAGARYFKIGLSHPVTLIGTDNGLLEAPVELSEVLMTPGDRVDLMVQAPQEHGTQLTNRSFRRLHVQEYQEPTASTLATLGLTGETAQQLPALPGSLTPVEVLADEDNERHILFNAKLIPGPGTPGDGHEAAHSHNPEEAEGVAEFTINGAMFPDVPRFEARIGSTETWIIDNHTLMDHPFHMHGFRFQVLDIGGNAPAYRSWEDTVNVPGFGSPEGSVMRVKVRYDGFPGRWVYHCHILHHQDMGMMAEFDFVP
jgi:FtsP/CotA-like multicopper oxidase with cupredoxin domain